jgi:hypothetical protein
LLYYFREGDNPNSCKKGFLQKVTTAVIFHG